MTKAQRLNRDKKLVEMISRLIMLKPRRYSRPRSLTQDDVFVIEVDLMFAYVRETPTSDINDLWFVGRTTYYWHNNITGEEIELNKKEEFGPEALKRMDSWAQEQFQSDILTWFAPAVGVINKKTHFITVFIDSEQD